MTMTVTCLLLLVAVMAANEDSSLVQRKGRPEVPIGEDQLQYLVEQGFKVKDISDNMFIAVERQLNER